MRGYGPVIESSVGGPFQGCAKPPRDLPIGLLILAPPEFGLATRDRPGIRIRRAKPEIEDFLRFVTSI